MSIYIEDEERVSKKTAREILSMIELICFSKEYLEYRINRGSNGTRDLIIENIKQKYDVR